MFDLRVCGVKEAGDLVESGWPTRVLSVVSPTLEISWTHPRHMEVRVHDIEHDRGAGWVVPQQQHLDLALEFTRDLRDNDRLIVHCRHGIGRSTATAIGVCMQHGMDAETAYHHVESLRSLLLPNIVIITLVDQRFHQDGRLLRLVLHERRVRMQQALGSDADPNRHGDVLEMKSFLETQAISSYTK